MGLQRAVVLVGEPLKPLRSQSQQTSVAVGGEALQKGLESEAGSWFVFNASFV